MKVPIVVFTVFMLIVISVLVTHELSSRHGERTVEDFDKLTPLVPKHYINILFMFITILLGYVVQSLLMYYRFPTPYDAFMVLIGLMWGIFAFNNDIALLWSRIVLISPNDLVFIYVPVVVFNLSFCADVPIFLKTLPQIVVIGIFVAVSTSAFFGFMIRLVIDVNWEISLGILFGIFCTPTYPKSIVYLLKQQSLRTKHISVLLEGEAVFTIIVADLIYRLLLSDHAGYMVYWYQFLMVTIRIFTLGIVEGFIFGLLGRYLVRKMYSNKLSVFTLFFALPLVAYANASVYGSGGGSIVVAVVGLMMSLERSVLSKDIDQFLIDFWEVFGFIMDVLLCVISAIRVAIFVIPYVRWNDYALIVVTFLLYYITRFICFFIYSPALSRLGYGMDLRNMIVVVWSGLKCPFSLLIVSIVEDADEDDIFIDISRKFKFYILGLYSLSLLVNGSFTRIILEFLGLRQISVARQVNMNNCMSHVFTKRERTMAILKMDRFLTDTNWRLVVEATTIRHPYHIDMENEDEDQFLLGYRFAYCPECKKEVAEQPTEKELKEMTKEAKMRVLKVKKMSYSRQFENGMISKEGIRILSQAVELAMDSGEAEIELKGLEKKFTEQNCYQRYFKKYLLHLEKKDNILSKPKKYWRRVCYHLVQNRTLDKILLPIIICNVVALAVYWPYHSTLISSSVNKGHAEYFDEIFFVLKLFFTSVYLLEFGIKLMAYSSIDVCPHGIFSYFKSVYNIIDFLVLVIFLFNSVVEIIQLALHIHDEKSKLFASINLLEAVVILKLLIISFRIFYSTIIKLMEKAADEKMAFTYELGKSYATGESEVLDMLPHMIDNKTVREEIRVKIEADRVILTKLLGIVQKERPWVAITVKTKQAIRTVLSGMNEALNQLKVAGWVDKFEQQKIVASLDSLYKKVGAIKMVQPSPPKVIFKEVVWMAEDEAVIDFLFENVTVKRFDPGEVVFAEGNVADGIYIVVTGLFSIIYQPDQNVLNSLREYGRLPIVDYLSGTKYEEPSVDYIVSGNCIGELSCLTERPYNCTIVAESHAQVYVLSRGVLVRAMELSSDPVIGLECRIWKEVSIRIAVPMLLAVPAYQSLSPEQIKYALERAFVPNLSRYKIFVVTEMIEDIILIDGVAADFNTREIFVAPCCIPRTVQKIILPTSSLMNIPIDVQTRLLIIPDKNVDEYDVMMMAEDTCEMIATGSESKCLQHVVQERAKNRRKNRMGGIRSGLARQKAVGQTTSNVLSVQSGTSHPSATFSHRSGTSSVHTKGSTYSEFYDEEEKRNLDYQPESSKTKQFFE